MDEADRKSVDCSTVTAAAAAAAAAPSSVRSIRSVCTTTVRRSSAKAPAARSKIVAPRCPVPNLDSDDGEESEEPESSSSEEEEEEEDDAYEASAGGEDVPPSAARRELRPRSQGVPALTAAPVVAASFKGAAALPSPIDRPSSDQEDESVAAEARANEYGDYYHASAAAAAAAAAAAGDLQSAGKKSKTGSPTPHALLPPILNQAWVARAPAVVPSIFSTPPAPAAVAAGAAVPSPSSSHRKRTHDTDSDWDALVEPREVHLAEDRMEIDTPSRVESTRQIDPPSYSASTSASAVATSPSPVKKQKLAHTPPPPPPPSGAAALPVGVASAEDPPADVQMKAERVSSNELQLAPPAAAAAAGVLVLPSAASERALLAQRKLAQVRARTLEDATFAEQEAIVAAREQVELATERVDRVRTEQAEIKQRTSLQAQADHRQAVAALDGASTSTVAPGPSSIPPASCVSLHQERVRLAQRRLDRVAIDADIAETEALIAALVEVEQAEARVGQVRQEQADARRRVETNAQEEYQRGIERLRQQQQEIKGVFPA